METVRKKKPFFDRISLGFGTGILFPLIVFYVYYFIKYNEIALFEYLASLHKYGLLFKIMSLCVLSNLPLFYVFIHFKQFKGARGMVMSCFIYAFAVLIYRIVN
jgi:hypothetical protein